MRHCICLLLLCLPLFALAQDTDILLNHDLYHYADRLDIRGYTGAGVPTDLKPYGRQTLARVLARTDERQLLPLERQWHERMRLLADDSLALASDDKKPILRYLYRNGRDLWHYQSDRFSLIINPSVTFTAGADLTDDPAAARNPLPLYTNTRGAVIRGSAFGRLGFYTEVSENITRFPQFVYNTYRQTEVLYGEAFVKPFKNENAIDWLGSRAYVTFSPFREMRIKFGKDRAFWGNGYQSLLLSDYAADYLLLTVTTRVWKLEYVNHFTQMIDFIPGKSDRDGTYPRKYGAFHQLSFKPDKHLSLGVFESVVYNPWLPNGQRGFELQYLNPLIFYRAAEQFIGSPDNALLGAHAKWNLLNHVQLYGQFLLDDFNFGFFRQDKGYWGNKTGWQAGIKYIDAFRIPTLDIQAEYNRVRPYTYQHFNTSSNYAHYGQYLGHAAGANLYSTHLILRYHPLASLNVFLSGTMLMKGLDPNGINYGGDIRIPQVDRPGDFGNSVGQGNPWNVRDLYSRVSWQLWKSDVWIEAEGRYRTENEVSSLSFQAGLRMNMAGRVVKF